jgi:hypothetical protein
MIAVTTRNRLKSVRFCLPMLRARALIARQLRRQPGLVRYASGIRGPTEFLTLTVWDSREAMLRFMQSGAHERHMWLFSRWTASFWGMRWEPSADEVGAWAELRLGADQAASTPRSPLVAVGLLPPSTPRAGPLGPRPEGVSREPRGSGLVAVTALFEGARAMACRRSPPVDEDLVRWSMGLDLPPRRLAISVWQDAPGARQRALARFEHAGARWAMCWQPADYEIGHWDGLRLRQAARRRPLTGQAGPA